MGFHLLPNNLRTLPLAFCRHTTQFCSHSKQRSFPCFCRNSWIAWVWQCAKRQRMGRCYIDMRPHCVSVCPPQSRAHTAHTHNFTLIHLHATIAFSYFKGISRHRHACSPLKTCYAWIKYRGQFQPQTWLRQKKQQIAVVNIVNSVSRCSTSGTLQLTEVDPPHTFGVFVHCSRCRRILLSTSASITGTSSTQAAGCSGCKHTINILDTRWSKYFWKIQR